MHSCIHTPTTNTSTGMIWVTLNMGGSAANRQGISHCLESGHPDYLQSETWLVACFVYYKQSHRKLKRKMN